MLVLVHRCKNIKTQSVLELLSAKLGTILKNLHLKITLCLGYEFLWKYMAGNYSAAFNIQILHG